ncbi:MAG: hypothetical protein IJP15_03360 [Oscillospiraceae bacterium]|nr:hypothetical protein [Oscillospiraceae bacterium]
MDLVTVKNGELSQEEILAYVAHVEKENPNRSIEALTIELDGEFVNLSYTLKPVPFERIRRITGYLVGTMDHWNDAKRAEERDRVKHSL